MQRAHERDATMVKGTGAGGIGRGLASGDVSAGRGWSSGWNGYLGGLGVFVYRRGRRERSARDMMYSTICSLI